MPVQGMTKRGNCATCRKRVSMKYLGNRWFTQPHDNQDGKSCPEGQREYWSDYE